MSSIEKKIWLWISLDEGLIQLGTDQNMEPHTVLEFDKLRLSVEKDGKVILSEFNKTDFNNGKEIGTYD